MIQRFKLIRAFFSYTKFFLLRSPIPSIVITILLSLKWKCKISLGAKIFYPWNLVVGRGAKIGRCTIIASGKGVIIEPASEIGDGAILDAQSGWISIRDHAAVGPFVVMYGEGGLELGKYSMIAAHSTVVASSHIYTDHNLPIRLQGSMGKGIRIEDDVWVGANAVIQDGVSLGRHSIIGSGAVVRSDVNEFDVVAGVPARVIKNRKTTLTP